VRAGEYGRIGQVPATRPIGGAPEDESISAQPRAQPQRAVGLTAQVSTSPAW
jgi:hypothetical protein